MNNFGENLRKFRLSHNWSTHEMGRKMGLKSGGYISQCERRATNPGVNFKRKLSDAFPDEIDKIEAMFIGTSEQIDKEEPTLKEQLLEARLDQAEKMFGILAGKIGMTVEDAKRIITEPGPVVPVEKKITKSDH